MNEELLIPESLHIYNIEVDDTKVLGRGSYGVVYEAYYHGSKVAVKKLHSIFFEDVSAAENIGILKSWRNELQLMSKILHPNIVQFYGVYNSENEKNVKLSGNTYIVSELMHKSLRARNLETPKLKYNEIVNLLHDIAAGLCYLHEQPSPIMHRDLASKNILLTTSGQAKIADLGVAKIISQKQESLTRHPGTDAYMPVEAIAFENGYDCSIDVYALGVIGLELGISRDPKATQCLKKVGTTYVPVEEMERRKVDFADLESSYNFCLKAFILQCLNKMELRITAITALKLLKEQKDSKYYKLCIVEKTPMEKINIEDNSYLEEQNRKLKEEISKLREEISKSKAENSKLKEENGQLKRGKDNLEKHSVENHEKMLALYKKQDIDKQELEYYKSEVERLKKQHLESLPKKQITSGSSYISRDPPAASKPYSYNSGNKTQSLNTPHGSLVIPNSGGRSAHMVQPTFGHSTKPRPASAMVMGTSHLTNHKLFMTQRSHSEDNCLSDEIKIPPPLPSETSSSQSNVLHTLTQYYQQMSSGFVKLRGADTAASCAICLQNLKRDMEAYQRYIGTVPKYIQENPAVNQSLKKIDEQIRLLRQFNLHQISFNQTDQLSQVARKLQAELMLHRAN